MRKKSLILVMSIGLGMFAFGTHVAAVPLSSPQRTCLTKKYGAKVTQAITKAKKLNATQTKQLAACTVGANNNQTGSGSPGSSSSTSNLSALSYSLLWYSGSNQSGLGNVSDPSLLQLADGTVRLFFKNGNSPEIPLNGFDNKIHSYISSDNGKTWTLEDGVRIDVGSPVSVRRAEAGGYEAWGWFPGSGGVDVFTRFSSTTGKDFTRGSGGAVPTSSCKNKDSRSAGFIGDGQVEKVASGYLAYAHDLGSGAQAPFKRQACRLTSADGTNFSIDAAGTFAFDYDVVTNPELYRNSAGLLELILPIDQGSSKYFELRTSSNDGASWSSATELPLFGGDPERLDLLNGESLLAFGGFDQRMGGLLAVTKKVSSGYTGSREEKVNSVSWSIGGASKSDVKVVNLCRARDETANAVFGSSGSNLTITFTDSSTQGHGTVGCVYLLIGAAQVLR